MKRISIQVCSKDRHTELALLIQSLRTQTRQEWDLVLLDESQTPIQASYFLNYLINRIKYENHCVNIIRNEISFGVCNARNELIKQDYFNNDYICRLDDDVILEPDYLQKLLSVISLGYDIASGITPLVAQAEFIRDIHKVEPIINKKEFDKDGNIIHYGDDCGYMYNSKVVLPADEFRSCALMKKKVVDKIKYETNLSPTGFREEAFFSMRAKKAGFKIGVHTGAIAWHLVTPSGGVRAQDYNARVQSDDAYFMKWAKKMYKENVETT